MPNSRDFDEQPNFNCPLSGINFDKAKELFTGVGKKFTDRTARSLGLIGQYQMVEKPTNGAVLLFADNYIDYFPDAHIRLARFLGSDKSEVLDHQDLIAPISVALDPILAFVRRHTLMAAVFGATRRKDVPQYPVAVVREAVINALVHTDYSIKGVSIQVAIFDDRIEITNPGCLPFGLTMEAAISGISQLRNRVIGRVFRELNLIEQWGSGFGRMRAGCAEHGIPEPKIEELSNFFKVTLYSKRKTHQSKPDKGKSATNKSWQKPLVDYVEKHETVTPKKAQVLWRVTPRTTSTRLKQMCRDGLLVEVSTGPFDPQKTFRLR